MAVSTTLHRPHLVARCQPGRPRRAISWTWRPRKVWTVWSLSLGTAETRGGMTTSGAPGWWLPGRRHRRRRRRPRVAAATQPSACLSRPGAWAASSALPAVRACAAIPPASASTARWSLRHCRWVRPCSWASRPPCPNTAGPCCPARRAGLRRLGQPGTDGQRWHGHVEWRGVIGMTSSSPSRRRTQRLNASTQHLAKRKTSRTVEPARSPGRSSMADRPMLCRARPAAGERRLVEPEPQVTASPPDLAGRPALDPAAPLRDAVTAGRVLERHACKAAGPLRSDDLDRLHAPTSLGR